MQEFSWDTDRQARTGIEEAVYCEGKSIAQIRHILQFHQQNQTQVLLTRFSAEQHNALAGEFATQLEYCEQGKIAIFGEPKPVINRSDICIVTAGTSDVALAKEAQVTLKYHGFESPIIADVGVAGLHRLLNKLDEIKQYKLVIAVAGMEGALFSVLAGLIKAPVIAVPSSVGYGVSVNGQSALSSALSACAPGILTVNIDNAFGAAIAAVKTLNMFHACAEQEK
ncbi:nickel pincer cofactor biosynthesis protein LarB [Catenovulum sp. 2E275]|uniref:nickel pincer cofactor biosynthesis protein LarB n=1 Tax=Catenovulum sp. 2E275 TaxID=2980497 RepID=UPI0021CFADC9|nr:nickel pincer cofactor biosynthesis protein LarB [Catenovulum sp. 2E275]MCU4674191.1 nickel pincer cofactor biosynthesis protein LarB [Catenovulum sp. 2E275]